jgi:hypothetical protein
VLEDALRQVCGYASVERPQPAVGEDVDVRFARQMTSLFPNGIIYGETQDHVLDPWAGRTLNETVGLDVIVPRRRAWGEVMNCFSSRQQQRCGK